MGLFVYCCCRGVNKEKVIHAEIDSMLRKFRDIFKESVTLPQKRQHYHYIPLKSEAIPVSIRPYSYNFFHKNEIEKQVKETLDIGIIQPSHSSFSSLVLLVKKKDGSWRICIDYKELNKLIIKDKFRISSVDDLLEELSG